MTRTGRFDTEKSYADFLVLNADKWVETFWSGDKIKEIRKEWYLKSRKLFGKNSPRIDIFIELQSGKKIGIEVKKPNQVFHELTRSISQILTYGLIAEENGIKLDELVLIADKIDDVVLRVIRRYNLPIRIFVITKDTHGEYKVKC